MQDLLAGQVDMIFDNIPGAVAQLRAGKVRALGVTSLQRSPVVPEIPAMAEFLPGFDVNSWGGICGPAGLPPAMVEKLSALTHKALKSEDLKKGYLGQGATPLWMSPDDTAAYRAADEKRLAPIVKASGAKVE
jgi:tripartite-type tricarboxylate transporter receptor subunit TctC